MTEKQHNPWVEFAAPDITIDQESHFSLKFSSNITSQNVSLVIDIYNYDNAVHPEGHLGWWQFPIKQFEDTAEGRITLAGKSVNVSIKGIGIQNHWQNDVEVHFQRLIVIAVLRSSDTNAIIMVDKVPAFLSKNDLADFRDTPLRDWKIPVFAHSPFVLPHICTVRIVSRSMFSKDAVGNLCLDLYKMLKQNGIQVELYAQDYNLEHNDIIHQYKKLATDVKQQDQILYFFSVYDPLLEGIGDIVCSRKIVYFHGITNPLMLQEFEPELSAVCQKGMEQIHLLQQFDVIAANSTYNAKNLLEHFHAKSGSINDWSLDKISVIPPKLISQTAQSKNTATPSNNTRLLYVGRITSHKKIEHLLALFSEYLKLDPTAECWIAGGHSDEAYYDYLRGLEITQLTIPEGKVRWLGVVSNDELANLYASSSVYISMSEDEGFCLPVLEAMLAKLLVFAYGIPAILEVLNGTGIHFSDKDFKSLAKSLYELLTNKKRVQTIIDEQYSFSSELVKSMDGRGFLRLLEPTHPL